ncbi:Morph_protein1 domain-containing protein [Cephalotus follicularis]|uniref:Morph_protein1 domain-containing protein n=1 Tax=Cephalotus follicularis TaxID=3775 RepID=A0A1Q3B239_CEPFO|nr:Morph_protein1 domain-containing protein [Cephalotus follicularis]
MTESQSESLSGSQSEPLLSTTKAMTPPEIPIEIVSEEEMALIEAAIAATRSSAIHATLSPSSSLFQRNVRSIKSITLLSKRGLSDSNEQPDFEDAGHLGMTQMRSRVAQSFLNRFRRKRGLSVTDITATEWCEKQMESVLLVGKRRVNRAMRTGVARHAKLEAEVVQKVKVRVKSREDVWATKFMNFINGSNQLLFEGLTRELPIIGFVEGVWMVGVIDEIRMPVNETDRSPLLVDTKTRVRDTLPAEPQRRNGSRLQLMCYKYLWDHLIVDNFPSSRFFDFFSLNRYQILTEEIIESTASAGYPAKTLDDIVRCYRNSCSMLPLAHNQLLLRYELQKDSSLLGEDEFTYDFDWTKSQIHSCLEFWLGEREASYAPEEERWKCRFCQFASVCPADPNSATKSTPPKANVDSTLS